MLIIQRELCGLGISKNHEIGDLKRPVIYVISLLFLKMYLVKNNTPLGEFFHSFAVNPKTFGWVDSVRLAKKRGYAKGRAAGYKEYADDLENMENQRDSVYKRNNELYSENALLKNTIKGLKHCGFNECEHKGEKICLVTLPPKNKCCDCGEILESL